MSIELRFFGQGGRTLTQSEKFRNLRSILLSGIQFLEKSVRSDGGVSAVVEDDVSGIWTTSEALEVLCITPFVPHERFSTADRMWTFLERAQINGVDGHDGAWPMVKAGQRGSAIATGHAIAAIKAAQNYFRNRMSANLLAAIDGGVTWLLANQAPGGGWGIEPASGSKPEPYMISTVHAVMGLTAAGYNVDTSDVMRAARQWILRTRDRSGGFATAPGFDPDPCNTARAIRALLQMRAFTPEHRTIRQAIAYLKKTKPAASVWAASNESFVVEGGSGELTFTRNTPADALEALVLADPDCRETAALVEWFIEAQQPDGSWRLHRAEGEHRIRVATWSTSGAIRALVGFEGHLAGRQMPRTTSPLRTFVVFGLSIGLAVQTVLLLGASPSLTRLWTGLPGWVQTLLVAITLVSTVILLTYSASAMAVRRFRREE